MAGQIDWTFYSAFGYGLQFCIVKYCLLENYGGRPSNQSFSLFLFFCQVPFTTGTSLYLNVQYKIYIYILTEEGKQARFWKLASWKNVKEKPPISTNSLLQTSSILLSVSLCLWVCFLVSCVFLLHFLYSLVLPFHFAFIAISELQSSHHSTLFFVCI